MLRVKHRWIGAYLVQQQQRSQRGRAAGATWTFSSSSFFHPTLKSQRSWSLIWTTGIHRERESERGRERDIMIHSDGRRGRESVVTFSVCHLNSSSQSVPPWVFYRRDRTRLINSTHTHSHYTQTLIKNCQDIFNLPTQAINELLHTVTFQEQLLVCLLDFLSPPFFFIFAFLQTLSNCHYLNDFFFFVMFCFLALLWSVPSPTYDITPASDDGFPARRLDNSSIQTKNWCHVVPTLSQCVFLVAQLGARVIKECGWLWENEGHKSDRWSQQFDVDGQHHFRSIKLLSALRRAQIETEDRQYFEDHLFI